MAEIDTRIQVPTLLTQIQQAASSAQGLGQNVLGGMRLAESKRQFDEQQSSMIRQQALEQARMVILAGRFSNMNKAIQAAGDDDAAVLDILQQNADVALDPAGRQAFGDVLQIQGERISLRNRLTNAKQNSIAAKMLQESQSQMIKDAENFEPVDRGRFLTMFNESQGAFTPEIEEFYREATKRAPIKATTESNPAAKVLEATYTEFIEKAAQERAQGNEEVAVKLEERAKRLLDFSKVGKEQSVIDTLLLRSELEVITDPFVNRDPKRMQEQLDKIRAFGEQFKARQGTESTTPTTTPKDATTIHRPTSQAEYDSLPSGSIYFDPVTNQQKIKR